jgi:6-phosphogluconolactonase
MKKIIYGFLLITFFLMSSCQPKEKNMKQAKSNNKHLAFIGTYTKKEGHVDGRGMGVGIFTTDNDYKNWELKNNFSDIVNPSFICHSPNHDIIYAVSESGNKSVIKVLTYNVEDYSFKEIQSVPSLGNDPCHISTDQKGKFLWAANYSGGNVASYKINKDGTLLNGNALQHHGTGPNRSRQEGPHAHYVHQHPSRSEVYAVDLGADKIYRYQMTDTGLELNDSLSVTSGAGCRHLTWHPKGDHLYIINELNGTIELWEWHGTVKERQQIIRLSMEGKEGYPGSGAIQISNDGQYLYASLRGAFNEIIVLKKDPNTFQMEIIQRVNAGGSAPRFMNFTPDEKMLTVALQDDDAILFFEKDQETGKLNTAPQKVVAKSPVCIVYKK